MKVRLSILSLLAAFLVLALACFASAASLTIVQPIAIPTSVAHNVGSFVVSFNLTNIGQAADLAYSLQMTSGIATLGAVTPVSIGDGSTTLVPAIVTATINFPAGQSGQLVGKIIADPSGAGGNATQVFTIPIVQLSSLDIVKTTGTSITKSQNGTFTIKNTGNQALGQITLTSSASFVSLDQTTISSLNVGATSSPINIYALDLSSLNFGDNSVTITAVSGTATDSETFNVERTFCKSGPAGNNLSISDFRISSSGSEDETWKPLDIVKVEVEADNDGDVDAKEVQVELGLYNSAGKNKVGDLEFLNSDEEKISIGTINDNDHEKAIFEFKVPADVDTGNYKLVAKAYSKKSGETSLCADDSADIDVEKEDKSGKLIAFDNMKFTPTEASCGDSVTLTTDVFNVGDEDQDQVQVLLLNNELGISATTDIREDFNQGDKQSVSFTISIPQDATDKTYDLALRAKYDYRNGAYHETSDSETLIPLKIVGCVPATPRRIASISASLVSEAKAGQELSVKSTITNLGTSTATFAIGASGYDSWAVLNSISNRIITINAGESKEVIFTFDVNQDAAGAQSFSIETQSGGKVETREVEVNLAEQASGAYSLFKGNSLLWVIGIINVILIILVIVVAVRVSRR